MLLLSYVSVNSNWVHPPPGKIFLSERIPATRTNFLSNSLPWGQKMMVKFPRGGAKFSKIRRNSPLSLQKILKKFRKLRDSTNFLFGELTKLLNFRLKQNHSKVFKYSSLQYFKNIYIHKYIVLKGVAIDRYFFCHLQKFSMHPSDFSKSLLSFLNLLRLLPSMEAKINYSYEETLLFV